MLNMAFNSETDSVSGELNLEEKSNFIFYLFFKRIFDFLFALIAAIVFSPVFIVVSVAIKLTSKGPSIYRQVRVGKNGKLFTLYKFRTMVDGAEVLEDHLTPELVEKYKRDRKLENDPRVTKVGSVLRRSSLDELPQIFNILKGNMSIIGPRPIMPEEIEMYGESYSLYTSILPGLTGLWQVKCRHITAMSERARLDAEYIKNIGMFYDLGILLKTFGVVMSKKGAC